MAERKEIRNSTAEFLIFQIEGKEQGVEVFYKDKTVWCTQKAMGTLFDVNIPAISKHLKNIYEQGELTEERTVSKMEIVRMEGNRQVKRETVFYNLDAVISVGYRVNSIQRAYCENSLYVDMFWIRREWRTARSLAKIILNIC